MAKVSFYTVGCKLNQYDTELIAKKLEKFGFERVDWADDADLYIVNSCNVTHKAAADSRRKLFAAKNKSPESKVVITGCYAQIQPELLSSLGDVDLVVQNDEKDQPPGAMIGVGIAIGAGAGTAIGVALGNIALGVAIGMAIGVAVGAGLAQRQASSDDGGDESQTPE